MKHVDAVIVGSGPAGVSAAFPLIEAGMQVIMLDGGKSQRTLPPNQAYLDARITSTDQHDWMIGSDFHALRSHQALSPKMRVPTHSHVFSDFNKLNRINPSDFVAIGSLAPGGLSNAWGCGVAKYSPNDLSAYPFPSSDLELSYRRVAKRIGISGSVNDDLSNYFSLDELAQPPIPIGKLQSNLYKRYLKHQPNLLKQGFRIGRSRVAVLSQDLKERQGCDLLDTCLWGCQRGSLYSATHDIKSLKRNTNFDYRPGYLVENIGMDNTFRTISGHYKNLPFSIKSTRVILAAGTLASTRIALAALNYKGQLPLQDCPMATFLLFAPMSLGVLPKNEFGLGQLSYALNIDEHTTAFGSLFSTMGIPRSEFIRYLPTKKRYGIDLMSSLLSSCAVGNMFLPGNLTEARVSITATGALKIEGGYSQSVDSYFRTAKKKVSTNFRKLRAVMLPTSFKQGKAGNGIHYSCTMPMQRDPKLGQTNVLGEPYGLKNVHLVDGSSLSAINEKSPTLLMMANADRISALIAQKHFRRQE